LEQEGIVAYWGEAIQRLLIPNSPYAPASSSNFTVHCERSHPFAEGIPSEGDRTKSSMFISSKI